MRLTIIVIILSVLASCNSQEASRTDNSSVASDSLTFTVALLPQLSALPVYYAEATGMTEAKQYHIRLLRYGSQMDVDTALLRNHAHIALCDSVRAQSLQEATSLQVLLTCDEPLSLMAHEHARATKFRDLKDKMVAITRSSNASAWCNELTAQAGMGTYDIFRPQINDVALRASMLNAELLDAAILPEPYTTVAMLKGHTQLATTENTTHAKTVWVTKDCTDTTLVSQTVIDEFTQMYNQAVEEMNAGKHPDVVRHILVNDYALDTNVVDTLQLHPLKPAKP